MTMIGQVVGEEVVWRRFYQQWTTYSDLAPQETPLSICRLVIGHCEVIRGQWPQVTLDDFETHVMQGQWSQLVMHWHQSHQLSPFKSIAPRQVAFTHDLLKSCRRLFPLWRHNFVTWPDLTKFCFHERLRKGRPISYRKFQHDTSNGLASSLEKLMGGCINPPPLARVKIAYIDWFPDFSIWAVFGHMQNFDRHIAVVQLYTWVFGLMEAKRGINFVVFLHLWYVPRYIEH